MLRARLTTIVLVGLLCTVSCSKKPTPAELALESKTAGQAPSAANILQLTSPTEPIAATAAPLATESSADISSTLSNASIFRHWLMLVAILLVLFFVSLILFHSLGRRLRQKSFRAHTPTRHVDIWASHKPPQFLDP